MLRIRLKDGTEIVTDSAAEAMELLVKVHSKGKRTCPCGTALRGRAKLCPKCRMRGYRQKIHDEGRCEGCQKKLQGDDIGRRKCADCRRAWRDKYYEPKRTKAIGAVVPMRAPSMKDAVKSLAPIEPPEREDDSVSRLRRVGLSTLRILGEL